MSAFSGLNRVTAGELPQLRRDPIDPAAMSEAASIIEEVRRGGGASLIRAARRFGEIEDDRVIPVTKPELERALHSLPSSDQELLRRIASRIADFARAQLGSIQELTVEVPGGVAGHRLLPVERVACYAPGGNYPLPSTMLMTAIPAKVAGVKEVYAASPNPTAMTLAAAAAAGVDIVYPIGGAQAIAAFAYGVEPVRACDMIVGPGNKWVTAAKLLVSGRVAIDLPGGPSELVVIADSSANPAVIAADLLAQAEHDVDAIPVVVSPDSMLLDAIDRELISQLNSLPTADTARQAVNKGYAVITTSLEEAVRASNRIAPEHLQLHVRYPDALTEKLRHYGALFVGSASAEVFGDYGAGPNHVLPTGGSSRAFSGLSVFQFLRTPTTLRLEMDEQWKALAKDTALLARHEGLEAHARAAEIRLAQQQ
jgi:phosphoribosyl-ATP pyrophosphohydrolase/phosphoribosyl-AMP cyclohydrolase/histidinol dehydrogenase